MVGINEEKPVIDLRPKRYNLRERINLYGGMVIGTLAPIIAIRYTVFRGEPEGVAPEIGSWIGATILGSLPALIGFASGLGVGKMTANDLARARFEREGVR